MADKSFRTKGSEMVACLFAAKWRLWCRLVLRTQTLTENVRP